jgi:hypothetical protein
MLLKTSPIITSFILLAFVKKIMGYYLETFATWLREDMALSDDIEILRDRAVIPSGRKRRPTTRWDHLAKQQSFSMPKVPSRSRRLGDIIEEDTATESSPFPKRTIKQSSLSYPPRRGETGRRPAGDGNEGAARPSSMVKQTSLDCCLHTKQAYDYTRNLNSLAEVELMTMPRLVKQKSFSSVPLVNM